MNNRGYSASGLLHLHNNKQVKIAHLVMLELPTISGGNVNGYFTDYGTPITYNGQQYITNRIKSISDVTDNEGLRVDKLTIEVYGTWEDELARALKEPTDVSYVHKDITIYRAYLDENDQVIDMAEDGGGPIVYYKGRITNINLKESPSGGSSVVSWYISNHFSAFEQVTGRLGQDTAHRGLVTVETSPGVFEDIPDPTVARKPTYTNDLGFMHAETAIDVEAEYKTTETRYKMKRRGGVAGLAGMKRLVEYEVEVTREMDVRVDLTAAYLPIVYGVRKVPVKPVFVGVDSANPNNVYSVYTICEGEIKGILNFYIGGKTIVCGGANASLEAVTTICLGNQRTGDTIETVATGGSGTVGAPTVHGTKYEIRDETGNLDITVYHGKDNQTADPDLVSIAANQKFLLQGSASGEEYWGTQHRLLDTAYIVVKSEINQDRTELPDIEVVVEAGDVTTWAPSDVTPAGGLVDYTQNMAWYLLDYLTRDSGGQLDLNDIDIESFTYVAQILGQEDTSYDVAWCPYWRYLGWKTPASTYIDAHGNTQYYRSKYQCNCLINTDEAVFKNVDSMLSQINGTLNYVGGKYVLSVENDHPLTQNAIGEDTIISWEESKGSIVSKNNASNNSYNTIDARISDPGMAFSNNSIVFFNAEYKAADAGIEKKGRFQFPYITNYYTARSLASQTLKRSRYQREFTVQTYFKYSYLKVNDAVLFYYPRFFGETPRKLLVSSIKNKSNGMVELTLRDFDVSIYQQEQQTDKSEFQIPPVLGLRAPTNLEILQDWTIPEPDNTSLLFKFSPSTSTPILRYEVRWAIGPTGQQADQIRSAYSVPVDQLDNGKVYSFLTGINPRDDNWTITVEARAVSSDGRVSIWVSDTLSSTDALLPTKLPEVENFRVTNLVPGTKNQFYGSSIELAWNGQSEQTTNYELIFYNPLNEAEVYSSWITTTSAFDEEAFSYTINRNMADYLAWNASSGIFRDIGIKIRARANVSLVDGRQGGAYEQEGNGPWSYIEV